MEIQTQRALLWRHEYHVGYYGDIVMICLLCLHSNVRGFLSSAYLNMAHPVHIAFSKWISKLYQLPND